MEAKKDQAPDSAAVAGVGLGSASPAVPSHDPAGFDVTPEMIEAAAEVFWSNYPDSAEGGELDLRMCRAMIEAALAARSPAL